jgi:hypothetical protein
MNFRIILILLGVMIWKVSWPQEATTFPQPFVIDIDPMERLLLINIENDPDSLYVGFEPQVFNDTINGKGHLVIGWRTDGMVDVFHQPGLRLNPGKYVIAGKGLANMVERGFGDAHYELTQQGVQARYRFLDIHGREIVLIVSENNPRKRNPFGLLAPMGSAAESPSSMPLILLRDFYFVRKKNTEIIISVNGRKHKPDKLPMPIDGTKMYFTRYCPDPLIANLNPNQNGQLPIVFFEDGIQDIAIGKYKYLITWNNGNPAIKTMIRKHQDHPVELRFNPAFPNIATLSDRTLFEGSFEIEGDYSTGKISGKYSIYRENGQTKIELFPCDGWQPRPDRFSLRFLYTVGSVFKQWPTTYRWEATITDNNGTPIMQSKWTRNGR